MKNKLFSLTLAVIAGLITLVSYPAHAFNQGQCVMVKTTKLSNGYEGINKPVFFYNDPEGKHVIYTHKPGDNRLEPFYVGKTQGQFMILIGSETIDTPDTVKGKPVGWVRKADFVLQSPRNCNF